MIFHILSNISLFIQVLLYFLLYRVVDEKGNKVSVPIKASDFHNNQGLKYLEAKFAVNETARQPNKGRAKNAVDLALIKNKKFSVQDLIKVFESDGINTIVGKK